MPRLSFLKMLCTRAQCGCTCDIDAFVVLAYGRRELFFLEFRPINEVSLILSIDGSQH